MNYSVLTEIETTNQLTESPNQSYHCEYVVNSLIKLVTLQILKKIIE